MNASCYCEAGYTGLDCAVPTCPNECSGRGQCRDWTCACDTGYTGPDCSLLACAHGCALNEHCYNGTCACKPGWTGRQCDLKTWDGGDAAYWDGEGYKSQVVR